MLPQPLIASLANIDGFDQDEFIRVHQSPERVTSIRINPGKSTNSDLYEGMKPVPWSSYGYYLPSRPIFTFDPLLHAGAYYVQEASSMFLEQAFKQYLSRDIPYRVLDLCGAPGGKSTHIQSLVNSNSLLVSNEVIRSRVGVLEENLAKWGSSNVVITNNDPAEFAKLPGFFDVMVVDAPCSGSGLFRRDPKAVEEWSPEAVTLCSQRQQRILLNALPSLAEDGLLVYSTCSFSREENEEIADWLSEQFDMETLQINLSPEWNIVETRSEKHHAFGYRFFPDRLKGEGFFLCCFRRKTGNIYSLSSSRKTFAAKATKSEQNIIEGFINPQMEIVVRKFKDRFIAWPMAIDDAVHVLEESLYIRKAGVTLGKIAGQDFLPDHELALSFLKNPKIVEIELKKQEALQYLRREEVKIDNLAAGWCIVSYKGFSLGWIKVLKNRINNYYPKNWRIVKTPEV